MHTRSAASLCILGLCASSQAQESHWINAGGGSFGNPANWSPAVVPDGSKRVFFDPAALYTVQLDAARTINGITITAGGPALDLAGLRLTLTNSILAQGAQFTLRNGEVYFPPMSGSLHADVGSIVIEEDAAVYQLGGISTIDPGATLIIRGDWLWCTPQNQCTNFTLRNLGYLRVEGGVIAAGSFDSSGLAEMVGGTISHDGGSSSGTLVMSGGARISGWSATTLSGDFHLSSGSRIDCPGGSASWVGVRGQGVLEGEDTRFNGLYRLDQNAHLTLRNGARVGPETGGLRDSSTLVIAAGGNVTGSIDSYHSSTLRREPGAIGPASVWITSPTATFEFLVDGANQQATTPIPGANSAQGRVLMGYLNIEVQNPNSFRVGDTIPLFTHPGGFTGSFGDVNLPALDGGRALDIHLTPTQVVLRVLQGAPSCYSSDFNGDGDSGTDQDIEAFFACLGGHCCPTCASADFNGDGDTGTDQDIEAFFRILGGGPC